MKKGLLLLLISLFAFSLAADAGGWNYFMKIAGPTAIRLAVDADGNLYAGTAPTGSAAQVYKTVNPLDVNAEWTVFFEHPNVANGVQGVDVNDAGQVLITADGDATNPGIIALRNSDGSEIWTVEATARTDDPGMNPDHAARVSGGAFLPDGDIITVDFNGYIRIFDPADGTETAASAPNSGLGLFCRSITVDADGAVYIVQSGAVKKLTSATPSDPDSWTVVAWTSAAFADSSWQVGPAVNYFAKDDSVISTEHADEKVYVFNADGSVAQEITGFFGSRPRGVAAATIDDIDYLFVAGNESAITVMKKVDADFGETAYTDEAGKILAIGYVKDDADLGLSAGDTIVDVVYNELTGNLLIAVATNVFTTEEATDGKVLVVNPADGSVIKTITGAYVWGSHGYGIDKIAVTEDGVILGANTVGDVFKIGTETDDVADGTSLRSRNDYGFWGPTRNFDAVGNYNDGTCVIASGRGNRIRLSANSDTDVDDFAWTNGSYDVDVEGARGIVLSKDASRIYSYTTAGVQVFRGLPDTAYFKDADASANLTAFGWETILGGDVDAGIVAVGGNKSDLINLPEYGYYYNRVAFRNIFNGAPIGNGNSGPSGWSALDEGVYWAAGHEDNPYPGLFVTVPWPSGDTYPGGYAFIPSEKQIFAAYPGGLMQYHYSDDFELSVTDWTLFGY